MRYARNHKYHMRKFINIINEALEEAPIGDMEFHGDMDTAGSFRQDDLKKFRSPEWKAKVIRMFERSPHLINVYIVNGRAEDGKVTQRGKAWIDRFHPHDDRQTASGRHTVEWAEQILGYRPPNTDNALNVMILSNEGDGRIGLTPWMIAHRIGHMFGEHRDRQFQQWWSRINSNVLDILDAAAKVAGTNVEDVIPKIGTFKSAKMGTFRNTGEFVIDLFAQYLTSGEARFDLDWVADKPPVLVPTPEEEFVIRAMGKINKTTSNFDLYHEKTWLVDYAKDAFAASKGMAGRPKTAKQLYGWMTDMVKNDRFEFGVRREWDERTKARARMEDKIQLTNQAFADMVNSAKGQFVSL